MFKLLFFALAIFLTNLSAQSSGPYPNREGGISNTQNPSSKQVSPAKETNTSKALVKNIATLEKEIATKIADLDRLHIQASEFNKDFSKEIFIINEKGNVPTGPEAALIAKYLEYIFEAGKTKEIKIVHRKKLLKNDLHSTKRTLTYTPGNSESIKITLNHFDTKVTGKDEVEDYKNLTTEAKIQALKAIDTALLATIYRLDTFIQRNELSKIEKNRNQLEGL